MLLLALLLAAPVPSYDAPSPFACTFAAAIRGERCAYEGASGSADARDSSEAAARAGAQECAKASKGDEPLRRDCEKAVAEASLGERCALPSRLVDGGGKLTAEAARCVEDLRAAVARTSRAAALSLSCCSCLADSRCNVSQSQCRRELADLMPGTALRSCMSRSCDDACSFHREPEPAREPVPPSPDPPDKT
jgi:hypothetical protein